MLLSQALHKAVQQDGCRLLTIFGDPVRSAAKCAGRVGRLAVGLRSLGVGHGGRVAVLGANSDRYHQYLLAVPWADAVVGPINHRLTQNFAHYGVSTLVRIICSGSSRSEALLARARRSFPQAGFGQPYGTAAPWRSAGGNRAIGRSWSARPDGPRRIRNPDRRVDGEECAAWNSGRNLGAR
jgi:acyl-CoA synthetase (AMP-forming)/AMP-acid ligase II